VDWITVDIGNGVLGSVDIEILYLMGLKLDGEVRSQMEDILAIT
jgi:hypothetical protein